MCAAVYKGLALANPISATFEKNAALLAAVWGRWGEAASHRSQSPLLDIGFDKDETHLAKVDLDVTWPVGSDGREEVLRLEAVGNIIQLLAVASEKDSSGAGSVADSYNVSLLIRRRVVGSREGLVVPSLAS